MTEREIHKEFWSKNLKKGNRFEDRDEGKMILRRPLREIGREDVELLHFARRMADGGLL
jgi:hypothetical protein